MDWAELERQAVAELEQQLAAPEHQRFLADLERWASSPEHQQYLADLERQATAAAAELERMLADVG